MKLLLIGTSIVGALFSVLALFAQPPGDFRQGPPESAETFASRMLMFDKNKDGALTKEELTETRLHRLFDRADANHDGTVTKEELTTLATKELENDRRGGMGFGGGPPGFGPPGGPMRGMPRPGEILPNMLRDRLELTEEQTKKVDALQKKVDRELSEILTDDQNKTLEQIRRRPGPPGGFGGPPPGGFGGPPGDGPGGFGRGPGGPPPDDRP